MSHPDSLYLTQCNFVLRPIVKFGCPRRLMPGHLLGVLEPSVVFQVNRDAGCTPGVTSDGGQKTRGPGPLPDSRPCIVAVKIKSSSGSVNGIPEYYTNLPSTLSKEVLTPRR